MYKPIFLSVMSLDVLDVEKGYQIQWLFTPFQREVNKKFPTHSHMKTLCLLENEDEFDIFLGL